MDIYRPDEEVSAIQRPRSLFNGFRPTFYDILAIFDSYRPIAGNWEIFEANEYAQRLPDMILTLERAPIEK